ncbi:MAG: L,D-transpeptidase family protein [Proteobacteria bacterium]|nr:L,D-transpeptidase family protein [Pseudomonadota bacterium]
MPSSDRIRRAALPYLSLTLALVVLCAASLPVQAQQSPENVLRGLVASGTDPQLRWPDFSDYRSDLAAFYDPTGYAPAWSQHGRPTAQAAQLIASLQDAAAKGLDPEDYDGSRWAARTGALGDPARAAHFDLALTVAAMRYASNLELGRIDPKDFKFKLSIKNAQVNLPQFVRRLAGSDDLAGLLALAEPPFPGYRLTRSALQHYMALAHDDHSDSLPVPAKTVAPGGDYPGTRALAQRLRLLGDLAADAPVPADGSYQGELVEAVKRFQVRHGLAADGRLGAQTIRHINVPLAARVQQLRLALERWRWVQHEFPEPPLVVNIPEFRLRAFDGNAGVALSMNVIVGRAMRHETPVFDEYMRYVVFRPYWNVPPSIQRAEIVPAIARNRDYIAQKNYEVTTHGGQVVTSGRISDEVLAQLRAGKLAVRQKPGPGNALGLVKLIFPNQFNVYLHSTPSPQLFAQARRDFSHGCIRVEKPEELVAWVLRDKPEWTLEKVRAAMQTGPDNVQVNLTQPVPVLILYVTAVPAADGSVLFFDDIYGMDADLKKALAKGFPYPR